MANDSPNPPDEDETVFRAVLYPHRSLSRRGFHLLILACACFTTLASVPFYLLGAWPVVGFFGIDIALLYVFFKLNYRSARLQEHVFLTHVRLLFARIDPRGRRIEWSFNPSWVRLHREDHEEFGITRLALVQRGNALEIAKFLGPAEKADFADAFARALLEARRGRDYL